MISAISGISDEWTLFLDRDGVINTRLVDDYVKVWDEFAFEPQALQAISLLSRYVGRIVVVTNQQGVGKGLMSAGDLEEIHRRMVSEIQKAGGKINRVYSCTKTAEEQPFCRKPKPGMALQARRDFPEIAFKKSLMVGDTLTDMQFGKRLGMTTVLVATENTIAQQHPKLTDYWFESLASFANYVDRLKPDTKST